MSTITADFDDRTPRLADPGEIVVGAEGRQPAHPAHPLAAGRWVTLSGLLAFLASAATAFTVSLVGEMPAGEFVLMATAGWAVLCGACNRALPGDLFRSRLLWALLIAQGVALVAYVASDIYRQSAPRDMARGWGRMVFLAVDIVAVAYLFSCSRKNFLWFVLGQAAGAIAYAAMIGPLFGDWWKFGVGAPLTFLLFLLAPAGGPMLTALAAGMIGVAHFMLDYRGLGALCLLAGSLSVLQTLPARWRWWIAPVALGIAVAGIVAIYEQTHSRNRATRSDIERSAMITAAKEAFQTSPLIGHGSWFSNSDVYDNFMVIRHQLALRERVGGYAGANREPGDEALHSQILVSLAEGGLFGGAFFIVLGAALLWAIGHTVLVQPWHRFAPLIVLILLIALWNLLFSPFSGAHRVYIAMACGLIVALAARRHERVGTGEGGGA